jgi:hypothetical protein
VLSIVAPSLQPAKDPGDRPYVTFSSGRPATGFAAVVDPDEACVNVELFFRGRDASTSLGVLRQDEDAIEAELGEQVDWQEDTRPARAALYLDSAHVADRRDWPRQHHWLAERLKRPMDVLAPRVHTLFTDRVAVRKVQAEFLGFFDQHVQQQHSSDTIMFPPPKKERGHREVELSPGVSIRVIVVPEQNWIWSGLQFGGDGTTRYDAAVRESSKLAVPPIITVVPEESTDVKWLGLYRLAALTDRSRWPEYAAWLYAVTERCRELHETLLRTAEAADSVKL